MYAILTAHIVIGSYTFNQVHEVKIERSVDMLSDVATIKLPTSFLVPGYGTGFDQLSTEKEIKVGDRVSITLGYEGIINTREFTGFVKSIKPTIPIEIECEDEIYLLRKTNVNKAFIKAKLRDIVQELINGTGVELSDQIPDFTIDMFVVRNANSAQVLQVLKEEFGLNIYMDDNSKLFAGLKQQLNAVTTVEYTMGKNVIGHSLEFKNKKDVKLKVRVVGIAPDNSRIEVEVGDNDGEQRTYHYYNITDKAKLKEIAEAKLIEQQFDGYRGSLTGFLWPYANRGGVAVIDNAKYPRQKGNYFIEKVTVTMGSSGARREVELGTRVSI